MLCIQKRVNNPLEYRFFEENVVYKGRVDPKN